MTRPDRTHRRRHRSRLGDRRRDGEDAVERAGGIVVGLDRSAPADVRAFDVREPEPLGRPGDPARRRPVDRGQRLSRDW